MITDGLFVSVHYTGTLNDGKVFDSSVERDPLEFQMGSGMVIPAFEEAVKSMAINDEKNIAIKAEDAYGTFREDLIQKVPLQEIKQFLEPVAGMTIEVMMPDGQHAPALIKSVTEEEVLMDFNHPLAGQDLNFTLKLVSVNETAQQADECCSDGECGDGCGDESHGGGCGSGGCGCGH